MLLEYDGELVLVSLSEMVWEKLADILLDTLCELVLESDTSEDLDGLCEPLDDVECEGELMAD